MVAEAEILPMDRLRLVVGGLITAAWFASFVVDVVNPAYDPPATIHLLMMVVAGALFAPSVLNRKDKDE